MSTPRCCLLSVLLICLTAWPVAAVELYVAPDGEADAVGTREQPTTLFAAAQRQLEPGSTVYMRSGEYIIRRDELPTLTWQGTAEARITLRSAPGEWARLDGGLVIAGAAHVTLRDFEMYRTRGGAYVYEHKWGEPVPAVPCGTGSENQAYKINGALIEARTGKDLELINLSLRDNIAGGAVSAWNGAQDVLIYGCLMIRNGCDDKVRGHGHGTYIQNGWPDDRFGESTKTFQHNITAYNHATGMKSYGQTPDIRSTYFIGNIYFGNGMTAWTNGSSNYLAGSTNGVMEDIVLTGNHFYQPNATTGDVGGTVFLGWGSDRKLDCTFTGNHVYGGGIAALQIQHWRKLVFTGNTIYDDKQLLHIQVAPERLEGWQWANNTFHLGQAGQPVTFNGSEMSLSELHDATGLIHASTVVNHKPTGVQSHLIPNEHDPDRAHLVLYNWDHAQRVPLDLSAFLKPGEAYVIYSALDYRGEPLAEGTFEGGVVSLDMPDDAIVGREFHALVIHRGTRF